MTGHSERQTLVPVDDVELWTSTLGEGPLAVVLCHGGPGLSDNLGPVAEMIKDLALVHRYDQRGGGRSPSDGPFTVVRFVDDLEWLRRAWQHETWVVGGHSWGGWLALLYALRYPHCVSGVVAISMPPFGDSWRSDYQTRRRERMSLEDRELFDSVQRRLKEGIPVASEEEERWRFVLWRTEFTDASTVPDFRRTPLYDFPANMVVNRALVADMDARASEGRLLADLHAITMPALFIHGQDDLRPPPLDVVESLPNSHLSMIREAGHLPWLERPQAVGVSIRDWLHALVSSS
jgi:proline iminopeptidase